jgi:hypothetical protein
VQPLDPFNLYRVLALILHQELHFFFQDMEQDNGGVFVFRQRIGQFQAPVQAAFLQSQWGRLIASRLMAAVAAAAGSSGWAVPRA